MSKEKDGIRKNNIKGRDDMSSKSHLLKRPKLIGIPIFFLAVSFGFLTVSDAASAADVNIDFSQSLGNLPRWQGYTTELRDTRGPLDVQLLKDIDMKLERTYYSLNRVSPAEGQYEWNAKAYGVFGNDQILDNITSHGAQPLVDISEIPGWLTGKPYQGGTEYEPTNYIKWETLIRDVLTHLKTKYPQIVYVSLLNEVMDDWTWYNKAYLHTSNAVDAVNNNLPAGVPHIKLGGKDDYSYHNGYFPTYPGFLDYVKANNLNLDFLTWHIYNDGQSYFGLPIDDINSSAVSTRQMKKWLDERGMNAELIISEWTNRGDNLPLDGAGNLGPINQIKEASWTIAGWSTLMETGIDVIPIQFANMDYGQPHQSLMAPDYAYFTKADIVAIPPKITETNYPVGTVLAKYNVYKMLKMSKDILVSAKNGNNIYAIASKDGSGIAAIFSNYQSSSQTAKINLSNLPPAFQSGSIRYERYLVDGTHSIFNLSTRTSKLLEKVEDISDIPPASFFNKTFALGPYATTLIVMTPAGAASQVATPQFNLPAGNYTIAQSVSISSTPGADIYYTTNGNDPVNSTASGSALYTAPILISSNTTIKAKAYKTGMDASGIATATYIIYTPVLSSISVSPSSISKTVGSSQTFSASPKDQFGNPISAAITWSSGNITVGTIAAGIFSALAEGTTAITAKSGSVNGTAAVAVSAASPPSNIITNPGFESGTSSWIFYTSGTGAFTASSPGYEGTNAANVALSSGGSNIQLYQYNLAMEPNTRYRLSFVAYSSTGHDLTVKLHKHDSPYTSYGLDYTADLGTSWQTFTAEFITAGFASAVNDGRLQLWLAPFASAGDIYYIDSIKLEKIASSPSATVSATITTVLLSGTSKPVSFSCSGLPAGASCSFSPSSINPAASTIMTISTAAITPAGTYIITVTGTGGGVTRTVPYSLTVNP